MAKRERQDDIATAVICWKNIFAKRAFKKWRKAFSWQAGGRGSGGGDDAAARGLLVTVPSAALLGAGLFQLFAWAFS